MNNTQIKSTLTKKQIMLVNGEYDKAKKNKVILYITWLFGNLIGVPRYYLGDWKTGMLMSFTLGGIGIWSLIDLFRIGKRIEEVNSEKELDIIHRIKATT